MCNTSWFSVAVMVTRTRLIVRFVRTFAVLIILLRLSVDHLTFIRQARVLHTAMLCAYCLDSVQ